MIIITTGIMLLLDQKILHMKVYNYYVCESFRIVSAGGFYHGKLIFPSEYPFKPPRIIMITPNGRFQTNTRLVKSHDIDHVILILMLQVVFIDQ